MSDYLVGKKINKMLIADDKLAIMFKCDDGDHIADVDADCCSTSWIESVELPALGFPALALSVSKLDMPTPDDVGSDFEYLACYGCKIVTDKGDIVIDYRNDSNGYYGGGLRFPDEYHYGGVYGQAASTYNWQEIEEV